ncbi:MAG: glycoside hydrolase family 65 protein, partial [Anaerolineaceae bacterium]|nr:glycoside hydrolase family 65 protein [Anaerolineaceae bacterium]
MHYEPWAISESRFDVNSLNHSETVFTIGNGYFCTRGALEESCPGEERVTFLHGVFDDMPLVFTELANVPDWLEFDLEIAGEHFDLLSGEILAYERRLDLSRGLLTRRVLWRSPAGKETEILFERFASMADQHLACQRISLTAVNHAGSLLAVSGLNGETDNQGLKHWQWVSQSIHGRQIALELITRATGIRLGMVNELRVSGSEEPEVQAWNVRSHPSLAVEMPLSSGQPVVLEKRTALYTSRETPEPLQAAQMKLEEAARLSWAELLDASTAAWVADWDACDVEIEGDLESQTALRFSLYHLLIAAPRKDERVNIGAKTLSGFGYRGHAFWDTEIFMLPFFTYTQPKLAHNLLSYRYHLLPGAQRKAAGNDCEGAQYPWESAATGDEVTPTWVPHPTDPTQSIRIWTGDIEIHISADIAYAIWQYWQATGDEEFFLGRGVEIIMETARYWASRLEWKEANGRYELTDVIGPDEYHDHVDNNAYTNYLARWNLQTAAALAEWMRARHTQAWAELSTRLKITPEVVSGWKEKAALIYC